MDKDNERLLTTVEAAKRLRVAPSTLRRSVKARRFPAIQVGRFLRFDPASLRGVPLPPPVLS